MHPRRQKELPANTPKDAKTVAAVSYRRILRISWRFRVIRGRSGCRAWFALSPAPKAFGVSPPPGGGYPGQNAAEGTDALFSSTSGSA